MYHKCDTYLFLKYSTICSQVIRWTFNLLQTFGTYMRVNLFKNRIFLKGFHEPRMLGFSGPAAVMSQ